MRHSEVVMVRSDYWVSRTIVGCLLGTKGLEVRWSFYISDR